MSQLPYSPRILADAACYVCKPHQQQRALEEFSGYHRGGPRVTNHTPYVQKDQRQLWAMLKSNHPYDIHELRRSTQGSEAQQAQPEPQSDPGSPQRSRPDVHAAEAGRRSAEVD